MKILAFDTATKSCSVALTDHADLLAEISIVNTETHSRHLPSLIRDVCQLARIGLRDIDGYAVTRGPGSFTGLRIGISTAIGLAQASGKPIAGVSTLHALATQAADDSRLVCPMIDARRGEVYCAVFRQREHHFHIQQTERVLKPQEALAAIKEPCIFVGNGATLYHSAIKNMMRHNAHFAADINNTIRAATVAWLANKRLVSGEMDDIMSFAPTYLRQSDAQISKNKRKKSIP